MRGIQKYFILTLLSALAALPAQAANLSDQVDKAVAAGDYKNAQTLVQGNPDAMGHAVGALLKNTHAKLTRPQEAVPPMTAASGMTAGVTPKNAQDVTADLKKIVKTIKDKELLVCNPETNVSEDGREKPVDPQKAADTQAVMSILDMTETMARMPAVVAIDPDLFNEIEGMMAQCRAGEDPLLAQRPGFRPQKVLPVLRNPGFPPPPEQQASPD